MPKKPHTQACSGAAAHTCASQAGELLHKDEGSQTLLERGLRGTERATRLMRQLMGFARTQSIRLRTVDVAGTLPGCHELPHCRPARK